MTITIATLDGTSLPTQFSYRPYVAPKRNTITRTANAVVVQAAQPQIIHGDGTIPFTCPGCYPTEFQTFYDLYHTTSLDLYVFTGYWGENFDVYFSSLDQPTVRGRIFDVSGSLQVMCVTTEQNAEC